jgi:hypothetical protein
LPSTKAKRTTSFGYGQKFDFTKIYKGGVPPGTYNVGSYIGTDRRAGYSFGQKLEAGGSMSPTHRYTPGPGAYELPSTLTRTSCSLAPRTTNFAERGSYMESPGPGTYKDTQAINKTGSYFVCKFKSSGATKINPNGSRKGLASDSLAPGPGRYEILGLPKDGTYFISKHPSSLARTFGRGGSRSSVELKIQTPGPGSYVAPSDFGQYVGANAPEATKSTKNFAAAGVKKHFKISTNTAAVTKGKGSVGNSSAPLSTDSRTDNENSQKLNDAPTKFIGKEKHEVKKPKENEVKELKVDESGHNSQMNNSLHLRTPNNTNKANVKESDQKPTNKSVNKSQDEVAKHDEGKPDNSAANE